MSYDSEAETMEIQVWPTGNTSVLLGDSQGIAMVQARSREVHERLYRPVETLVGHEPHRRPPTHHERPRRAMRVDGMMVGLAVLVLASSGYVLLTGATVPPERSRPVLPTPVVVHPTGRPSVEGDDGLLGGPVYGPGSQVPAPTPAPSRSRRAPASEPPTHYRVAPPVLAPAVPSPSPHGAATPTPTPTRTPRTEATPVPTRTAPSRPTVPPVRIFTPPPTRTRPPEPTPTPTPTVASSPPILSIVLPIRVPWPLG